MRILHTADWHLGQLFFDRSRIPEQRMVLDFILKVISEQKVDLLLVAGDIFDTANPPSAAEELYYEFLTKLYALGHCQTLIVGGNHDSALRLDAPRRILAHLKIDVVGAFPTAAPEEAIFSYEKDGVRVQVAAIPYLRDRDVRQALQGERFDDRESRTRAGVVQAYTDMAARLRNAAAQPSVFIATGHLTAVGGKLAGSERSIHIGNLGSIGAEQFPAEFAYVALGHLHHPQAVGGSDHIRYAGSPIPLSFSESLEKEIRLLTVKSDGSIEQEAIIIPLARELIRLKGSVDTILQQLENLVIDENRLPPWIEVTLTDGEANASINDQIRAAASEMGAEVLKVTLQQNSMASYNGFVEGAGRTIREWAPQEVFEKRLESYQGESDTKALASCFNEVLHAAQEGDDSK